MCWAVPVLRIHFTAEDLLRTRFAPAPAPLLELSLALVALLRGDGPFSGKPEKGAGRRLPATTRPMLSLVSMNGDGAMFLDPICSDFAEGLDTVLASPADLVAGEIHRVCRGARFRAWHRDLITRDRSAWHALAEAISSAYRAVLEPDWERVVSCLAVDVSLRGQMMSRLGLPATLANLYPGAHWDGTTLALPSPRHSEVRLGGAGLTATPSAYWVGGPLRSVHPDGSTVLIYPAATPLALTTPDADGDPLAELLGRTRAAALRVLIDPTTTSGLSAALGISVATASEHAHVLRRSGLIVTTRAGKSVLHQSSPLGIGLLARANPRPARSEQPPPSSPHRPVHQRDHAGQ